MTLVRWDPFRDLWNVQRQFDRMFADRTVDGDEDDTFGSWSPTVDIFESGDELVIQAEVPGVEQDDIDVRVEHGTLVLEGERRRETRSESGGAYRSERLYGKFSRSFRLPRTVDATKISARHQNGLLEITLPKVETAKPRKVKIQAA